MRHCQPSPREHLLPVAGGTTRTCVSGPPRRVAGRRRSLHGPAHHARSRSQTIDCQWAVSLSPASTRIGHASRRDRRLCHPEQWRRISALRSLQDSEPRCFSGISMTGERGRAAEWSAYTHLPCGIHRHGFAVVRHERPCRRDPSRLPLSELSQRLDRDGLPPAQRSTPSFLRRATLPGDVSVTLRVGRVPRHDAVDQLDFAPTDVDAAAKLAAWAH
jgi:hypothetical protein